VDRRTKWRSIVTMLLVIVLLGISISFIWRYRHDGFFRNEVALRLYALSTSRYDRRLLLAGDSNVARMSCPGDFEAWRILNLGVPGLLTETMLGYIGAHRQELLRFDAAILWIGINDLRRDPDNAAVTAQNVLAILSELSTVSTRLAVVRQAPLPEGQDAARTARINRQLAAMNAIIADETPPKLATIIAPFATDTGVRWKNFYIDDLHLNARGYGRVCAEAGRWLSEHE
jgi:lysophospholipase L1-like esterase